MHRGYLVESGTPILIDLGAPGLVLTDAENGVDFDLDGDGRAESIAWTVAGAEDAFLVLDRNNNGQIDNGTELFGDVTFQYPSKYPNGYLALSVFDRPQFGGNGDGVISGADAGFDLLRLWRDANQDGISTGAELLGLAEVGIAELELRFARGGEFDAAGNWLLWKGRARGSRGEVISTFDVVLLDR